MRRAVPSSLLLAASCGAPAAAPEPAAPVGEAVVVCGQRFPIGAPVVLWTDPGGYDGTSPLPAFDREGDLDGDDGSAGERVAPGPRYTPGRAARGEPGEVLVAPGSTDLQRLREVVDLFVVHYDACGTSRRCFEVLQDLRGLSVHFLLDLDGTLYQTLDLRDQAWHAAEANPRSIGVEIAHVGAHPPADFEMQTAAWYALDARGPRITIPAEREPSGVRTAGFVGRPARPGVARGVIQGQRLDMYDFTPEQYASLARLAAALCSIFPRIAPEVPRDAWGGVRSVALDEAELAAFSGILGHYHVTPRKVDPGPAFDWERLLSGARAALPAER